MEHSRRGFLRVTGLAGLGLAAGSPARAAAPSAPNILFVFADDHAVQAIGAYGAGINRTPHIDRVAAEGAIFENSFCTNSICAPSRAVVLTGVFSHVNGVRTNGQSFDGGQPTYPKLLRDAGYQTAMFGKWHLKSDPTGFDRWAVLPGQGNYYTPDFKTPEGRKQHRGYVSDVITDMTLRWLKQERDPGRPFLLHCWHKAPHRRWLPGPAHLTTYDDQPIPEPPTLFDDYSGRSSSAARHKMGIGEHMSLAGDLKVTDPLAGNSGAAGAFRRLTEEQRRAWDAAYVPKNQAFQAAAPTGTALVRWKYQRYVKDYLRCIASVDDSVGRLLAYLDQSGLARNTIVVYSSDQGFYLGEHGWFDKRWMYEESLRMPLLIRWPGVVRPGTRIRQLVQNLDYAPTLLAAAGLEPPDHMQGRSLLPLLRGEPPPGWRSSIYYHYFEHGGHGVPRHCGVRTERYKLIHFYATDEWELFDLEEDPRELVSVYDDPAREAVVRNLKKELSRLRDLYGDHTGEPVTHPDFDILHGIQTVKDTATGWNIVAAEDGARALQKVAKPFHEKLTLRTKLRTLRDEGVRNGMIAFGVGPRPEDVIRCGVYIRAGQYVILENGNTHLQSVQASFDQERTFEVTVDVDLGTRRVRLDVDGTRVEAALPRPWPAITYVGLGLNQTATAFSRLQVEGR